MSLYGSWSVVAQDHIDAFEEKTVSVDIRHQDRRVERLRTYSRLVVLNVQVVRLDVPLWDLRDLGELLHEATTQQTK